jgi:hypothetical protein
VCVCVCIYMTYIHIRIYIYTCIHLHTYLQYIYGPKTNKRDFLDCTHIYLQYTITYICIFTVHHYLYMHIYRTSLCIHTYLQYTITYLYIHIYGTPLRIYTYLQYIMYTYIFTVHLRAKDEQERLLRLVLPPHHPRSAQFPQKSFFIFCEFFWFI